MVPVDVRHPSKQSRPHLHLDGEGAGVLTRELMPEQAAKLTTWRKDHRWHPNQLRHAAATAIRAQFGREAAQVILGHAKPDTTLIYAGEDLARAREVMREFGYSI